MGTLTTTIIIAAAAAVLLCALTYYICMTSFRNKLSAKAAELAQKSAELARKDAELAGKDAKIEYLNQALEDKKAQKELLDVQIQAIKAQLVEENEKNLKAREEALNRKAKETFESISGDLSKDFEKMAKAFDESRKTQNETTAEIKEKFATTVKHLEEQTQRIGQRADNLASALKGEKKLQGCFGEMILGNILVSEGLTEGRDFDKEETIRSRNGITLTSDEDRRMRPDYILHYPDDSDIIVDAKTPINALDEYYQAATDEEKEAAARRNLDAVMNHVKSLSAKDYSGYATKAGRKTLDYVIMFIPNYGALQLAKQLKPDIWRVAFKDYNVLITTEETFIPFTRMIRTAWISHEQVRNQAQILAAAQRMIDRVAEFSKAHAEMGRKLDDAKKFYDQCSVKLKDDGPSIVTSARQLIQLGVPEKKKV